MDGGGAVTARRLSVIATRLGIVDRTFHAPARGDALILGTRTDRDIDVPATVVAAAHRCGYPVVTDLAAPALPTLCPFPCPLT